MQALWHGVPQLVIPMFFEQPWNGNQVEHMGAGVRVRVQYPIEQHDLGSKLTAALHRVLSSATMHPAAQHISHLMRAERWTPLQKAASELAAHPPSSQHLVK